MNNKNRNLLIGGVFIAIILAILAPFLASSNPDGLESTAEKVMPVPETEPAFQSPLPDYTIPLLGENNPWGGVISLIMGTLIVMLLAFGIASLMKKNGENKET
jgi:cobalt/nickel transport protein